MKTIILILLFCVSLYSYEKAFTILVDVGKLPSPYTVTEVKDKFQGLKTIDNAGGQPFRMTRILQPANTNYLLVNIVLASQIEKDFYTALFSKGIIKLIQKQDVISFYDNRIGGMRIEAVIEKYNELPADFNKDWSVIISTP